MCLDVYSECTTIRDSSPRARKPHKCTECSRTIEPGERYRLWVVIEWGYSGDLVEWRMCTHCWATIVLGCSLTGCPRNWWWSLVHDLSPDDGGFVGDILAHDDLRRADRLRMYRTVVGRRSKWRHRDGSLMDPIIDPWEVAA